MQQCSCNALKVLQAGVFTEKQPGAKRKVVYCRLNVYLAN